MNDLWLQCIIVFKFFFFPNGEAAMIIHTKRHLEFNSISVYCLYNNTANTPAGRQVGNSFVTRFFPLETVQELLSPCMICFFSLLLLFIFLCSIFGISPTFLIVLVIASLIAPRRR